MLLTLAHWHILMRSHQTICFAHVCPHTDLRPFSSHPIKSAMDYLCKIRRSPRNGALSSRSRSCSCTSALLRRSLWSAGSACVSSPGQWGTQLWRQWLQNKNTFVTDWNLCAVFLKYFLTKIITCNKYKYISLYSFHRHTFETFKYTGAETHHYVIN